MAAAKRFFSGCGSLLAFLFRPLEGNAWLVATTLVACAILGITSYHLWHRYGELIVSHPRYRLDPEHLIVTPQPSWIQSDVTSSAVTYGQLGDASLLDRELVLQVKQAFGVQPWVKRVSRVNKQFPSTVEVDVEYRRPVAMVEVPAGMFPGYDYEGLLPVDDEGYLLPVEMDEQEATRFPKIAGVDTSPAGPPGSPWGDPRVAQAAQIVTLLEDLWDPLKLRRVAVPDRPSATDPPEEASFVLITQQGQKFGWGSAPGSEQHGEDPAANKVVGLRRFLQEHGPLDSIQADDQARLSEVPGLRYANRRRPAAIAPR